MNERRMNLIQAFNIAMDIFQETKLGLHDIKIYVEHPDARGVILTYDEWEDDEYMIFSCGTIQDFKNNKVINRDDLIKKILKYKSTQEF